MTSKFNPKVFQDKFRIFRAIPGAKLLCRIYEWDSIRCEYRDPPRGGRYFARRNEFVNGRKVKKGRIFATLEEAKSWQERLSELSTPKTNEAKRAIEIEVQSEPIGNDSGPRFGEIVDEWKRRTFPKLSKSTQHKYESYLRLHFGSVMSLPIRGISPRTLDLWLDERKAVLGSTTQSRQRSNFDHELVLFGQILRYYIEYYDDADFRFPIKKRHRQASRVTKDTASHRAKDLSLEEFVRFRAELLRGSSPIMLASMATVQYFQALRISEVAAIFWEDVLLNWKEPSSSRLRICRHVVYMRGRGVKSYIEAGFKNASKEDPVKEQPLFPATFDAFKTLFRLGGSGLVFKSESGAFFGYREIQHAYDHAFARAGLPYRGTHVLMHGGTRNVYNETGDLAVAQQLLGNSDLQTTLIYAKRHKHALTKVAESHWKKANHSEIEKADCENLK